MKMIFVLAVALFSMPAFSTSAAAQNRWRIDSVRPAEVYVRNKFDLVGSGFGERQARSTMVVMRLESGRNTIHKPRILFWSNKRIRLETPDLAVPGRYRVGVYHNDELITNEATLTVLGGISIHGINPSPASPGDTIEIRGVHFGGNQVTRYVSINRLGTRTRLTILDWSDNLIRAQIPDRVTAGAYLLLIYYDETHTQSSDGVEFTIQRD